MNNSKCVGGKTELCGKLSFIGLGLEQWSSTTAELNGKEKKVEIKVHKREIESVKG